ncbi:MAG: MMPL family transporter, partial [Planctomycetia bacterium]|nr:MMPL family transporter [Planctomycetia bacterium]
MSNAPNKSPLFQRFAWVILLGVALATPVVFFGAGKAVSSNSNKVEDWLPAGFKETGELGWFRERFVGDQFVIVSWEGCQLGDRRPRDGSGDDPRIEQLALLLVPDGTEGSSTDSANELTDRTHTRYSEYFKSVMTARRLLNQLTAEPNGVPYDKAVARLTGSLIGADGKQTCLIVTLSDAAISDFKGAIARGNTRLLGRKPQGALFDALQECGIDIETVHIGGPPVDNVAIDEEGERTLIRLAGLSGLLGLGLAYFSLRSIKLTAIVFGCGILSAAAALASIWFTGEKTDAVVLSMPALVYVLAISGAVHLINYYRDAVDEGGLHGATDRAIAHGWKPALLCSITTALGLLSLYSSELVPIRKFGLYSAIGVMLMLVTLFLYLPAALQIWPVSPRQRRGNAGGTDEQARLSNASAMSVFWERFASWIIRHHLWVTAGCVLVVGIIGFGLTRVRTSIDLMKLFDGDARILRDYRWLEANVGRLVPMEIVLRFERDTLRDASDPSGRYVDFSLLDRLELVSVLQQTIEQRFGSGGQDVVGPSMSAVTLIPPLPLRRQGTSSVIRRSVTESKIEASYNDLLSSGYLRIDPVDQAELWRVSIRVAAFQDVDYGLFSDTLREDVEPLLEAFRLRRRILENIAVARQGNSYAGATVLWWRQESTSTEQVAQSSHDHLLATTLRELLQRDRVRLVDRDQDVAEVTLSQLDQLRHCDGLVLSGPVSSPDAQMIRDVIPHLVCLHEPEETIVEGASVQVVPLTEDTSVSTVYTGVVPIVYKAQRALLDSLIQSTFWSFVTILPLLMFVSRGVAAGMVAMLPNVLPVLVIFGGMGWLGFSVDIGSMMSASIALGVAVDDTIHYLTWFREDLNRTGNRHQAILSAYQRCATPTLQAALISGLGLSVFAFSTFTPTQQFGYLMLTILLAGVVAELVMLPAILAGPLGWAFRPTKSKSEDPKLPGVLLRPTKIRVSSTGLQIPQ